MYVCILTLDTVQLVHDSIPGDIIQIQHVYLRLEVLHVPEERVELGQSFLDALHLWVHPSVVWWIDLQRKPKKKKMSTVTSHPTCNFFLPDSFLFGGVLFSLISWCSSQRLYFLFTETILRSDTELNHRASFVYGKDLWVSFTIRLVILALSLYLAVQLQTSLLTCPCPLPPAT